MTVGTTQNWMWCVSIIVALVLAWRKYQRAGESDDKKLVTKVRSDAARALLRNGLDLVLCMVVLKKLPMSTRDTGLLGTVTSLMACYEMWPSSADKSK